MSLVARLAELGLSLPTPAAPVANYVPFKRSGHLLFISGMIPLRDGQPLATGRVGDGLTVEQGQDCARQCVLNALAWVGEALDADFSKVKSAIQLRGFVASPPDFTQHPAVINGASDLLVELLGEKGRHTRVAAGAASLPLGVPVEIDFVFEVD